VADKKIVLEVCPSSNISTKILSDWNEVGRVITTLKNNNVLFTINSDCPTLIETNVKEEFIRLMKYGILTESEVIKLKKLPVRHHL